MDIVWGVHLWNLMSCCWLMTHSRQNGGPPNSNWFPALSALCKSTKRQTNQPLHPQKDTHTKNKPKPTQTKPHHCSLYPTNYLPKWLSNPSHQLSHYRHNLPTHLATSRTSSVFPSSVFRAPEDTTALVGQDILRLDVVQGLLLRREQEAFVCLLLSRRGSPFWTCFFLVWEKQLIRSLSLGKGGFCWFLVVFWWWVFFGGFLVSFWRNLGLDHISKQLYKAEKTNKTIQHWHRF